MRPTQTLRCVSANGGGSLGAPNYVVVGPGGRRIYRSVGLNISVQIYIKRLSVPKYRDYLFRSDAQLVTDSKFQIISFGK